MCYNDFSTGNKCSNWHNAKQRQVTFIYIVIFAIQIVSKQLYSDNRKLMEQRFH